MFTFYDEIVIKHIGEEAYRLSVEKVRELVLSRGWNYSVRWPKLFGKIFGLRENSMLGRDYSDSLPSLKQARDWFQFGNGDVRSEKGFQVTATWDHQFWIHPSSEIVTELHIPRSDEIYYRERADQEHFRLLSEYPTYGMSRYDEEKSRDVFNNPTITSTLNYKFWVGAPHGEVRSPVSVSAALQYSFSGNPQISWEDADDVLPKLDISLTRVSGTPEALTLWFDADLER